ncbi:MAG: RNB domain-containing ribonuclease [Planctomycetes bacterium]|nr:RNB domain-containing ribonuclease [Planctomycetota bacterium]
MNDTESPRFADDAFERVKAFCTEPQEIAAIAGALKTEESDDLRDWLESLVFAGKLQRHKGKRYQAVTVPVAVGTYRRSRGQGASGGFVVPRDREVQTIDIPSGLEEGAQEGDLVLASFKRGKNRGRRGGEPREGLSGRVLSIVDARANEAAGVFEISHSGKPRVRLEGYNLPRYAYLQPHEVHRMKPGTVIRVKLLRKPDARGGARAEMLGSVGSIDNPLHDLDNLVALFGFPGEFTDESLQQARSLPRDPDPESFKGRIDLRKMAVITIDPKDAEDHDDAISIEQLEGGLTRLGVHIADVSRYVTPGSALDEDARFRATSVYLPGKLIPMLPKELSAGLCSLHDSVDRLAKSVFMVFDAQGELQRRELVESVVRVRRFLTYEEVLPVLTQGGKTGDDIVDKLLLQGRKLADALQKRRIARGALTLEIPRPHVIVDKNGLVTEISEEKTDPAHNLIEEFMLAANEAVAHFLLERGLPYIGRIHPAPEEDSIEDFWEFCEEMKLPKPDFERPGELQKFLDKVLKAPGGDAIHYALLRSLTRAVYHAGPELHYALAVTKYVHFTSPIRRYPDTVTHQVLSAYLDIGGVLRWERQPMGLAWADGSKGPPPRPVPGKKIEGFERIEFSMPHIAAHCTERSIRSDKGELAADQIKILRTLIPRVGEAFHGTVVSVSSMSITVRLDDVLAEGYIEFGELTDGWVEVHRFWAHYDTGAGVKRVMMGDRMEVEIAGIDLASRSLRLTPVGEHAKPRSWSRQRNQDKRDRRKRKGDRRGRR